jgi:uncharacterized protein YlzI (FlbEa/FlbD family)
MRDLFVIKLTNDLGKAVYINTFYIAWYIADGEYTEIVLHSGECITVKETVDQINRLFQSRSVLTCINGESR